MNAYPSTKICEWRNGWYGLTVVPTVCKLLILIQTNAKDTFESETFGK